MAKGSFTDTNEDGVGRRKEGELKIPSNSWMTPAPPRQAPAPPKQTPAKDPEDQVRLAFWDEHLA